MCGDKKAIKTPEDILRLEKRKSRMRSKRVSQHHEEEEEDFLTLTCPKGQCLKVLSSRSTEKKHKTQRLQRDRQREEQSH
jgi:hypothetical protein